MRNDSNEWIGGAWLVATYGLTLVLLLSVVSCIGGRRASRVIEGVSTETYVEAMRPASSFRGHLTFHLKHEVLHLELLSRLFERIETSDLIAWVLDEPTGQYARRAGFFCEFLTGRELVSDDQSGGGSVSAAGIVSAGGYIDALDARKLVGHQWQGGSESPLAGAEQSARYGGVLPGGAQDARGGRVNGTRCAGQGETVLPLTDRS